MVYVKGYVVSKNITVPGRQAVTESSQLFNDKWILLTYTEDEIAEIKRSKW